MVFGLRSRTSSRSSAASAAANPPPPLEASDQIGDSPDFGVRRRGPSQTTTSDSASLRSRTSFTMKRFFHSPRSAKRSQSTDSDASRQPSNGNGASKSKPASSPKPTASPKKSIGDSKSADVAPVLAPPTDVATTSGGSLVDAVKDGVNGGLLAEASSAGPRPSELFAGKGVQWNQLDLTTGRDLTNPPEVSHPVDLQKFLRERRQWIPTFKDDDDQDTAQTETTLLPKALEQLTFDDGMTASGSGGLKSLRDLEDTHKRKTALLPDDTIFQEPAGSNSLSPSASTLSNGPVLPPTPAAPARNQSFRISSFAAESGNAPFSARKSGSISRKPVPASEDSPQRVGSIDKPSVEQVNVPESSAATEVPPRPPKSGSRTPSRQSSQDFAKVSVSTPPLPSSNLASVQDAP